MTGQPGKEWLENGMMVAGANRAALETVTTGEKAILVAGVDYNAYSNIEKGELWRFIIRHPAL